MEVPFPSTVLDSLAEGVFTVDRDWKVTSFNRAAETITGYSRQEVIARKCWDIFHADRELGIHKTTLWRKMKKYGVEDQS